MLILPASPMLNRRLLLQTAAATAWLGLGFGRAAAQTTPVRSFYVSPSGSDSAAGTQSAPWRTISRAVSAPLLPGDEVVVQAGTYTERFWIRRGGNADTPTGYVTFRAAVPGTALIRPPGGTYSTLNVQAHYVIVDGFDVVGGAGHAIDVQDVHHVKVLNCIAHDSGGTGIQYNWCEFVTIEGNVAYNNASTNGYHCSGISIYQCRNISGDQQTSGYRTIVRNNISHGNFQRFSGEHTDGNGIIIDDFQSTQRSGFPNYAYPTLLENNLCHSNGGKGIQLAWSDNVTVRNNTCWHNNLDNQNSGTWRSELSNNQSSNNKWINNIGVANTSVNHYNTALGNQSYGTYRNLGTIWHNNLTFNGIVGEASVDVTTGNAAPTAANGNLLGGDPLFVSPASSVFDFRLRQGSPAISAGTNAFGVASVDLAGSPRVVGIVDIGAYEHDSSGTPPPPPPPTGALSIWSAAAAPAIASANDGNAVELGMRFQAAASGVVTGLRFFKGSQNIGTHVGSLWTAGGRRLARATFTNETASGWQEVLFAAPVSIVAGRTYVVSYHTQVGRYAITYDFFSAAVVNGPLTAVASNNGVFAYGSGGFPANTYRRSNYWVDVMFRS